MIYSADVVKALCGGEFAFNGAPQSEAEFNSAFMPVSGVDEHGVNVFETDPAKFPITWAQFSAKRSEMFAAEPMRLLRNERNRRIAETDWWVLADRTPTQAQLAYRQALRDITNTYKSLDDVVWPTKPE
jgi:hypothetical protein